MAVWHVGSGYLVFSGFALLHFLVCSLCLWFAVLLFCCLGVFRCGFVFGVCVCYLLLV